MADLTVTAAKVGLVKPLQSEVHSFIAAAAITAGQAVYMTTSGTVGVADASHLNRETPTFSSCMSECRLLCRMSLGSVFCSANTASAL